MSRVGLLRLLVVGGFIAALELLCRTGAISPRVLLAPSDMALRLMKLLASGKANADIIETLGNVAISLVLSVTGGFGIGALIHAFRACARPSIRFSPAITRCRSSRSIRCSSCCSASGAARSWRSVSCSAWSP